MFSKKFSLIWGIFGSFLQHKSHGVSYGFIFLH
nr:MAG TPA: hypothetical protein [Caudoviricetes sp.]